MRFRRSLIACVTISLVAGISFYLSSKPRLLAHHLARFNALKTEASKPDGGERRPPSRVLDYMRPSTVRWYLRRKPSWADDWLSEQQALVDLGYFQQRELILHRPAPTNPNDPQLDPAVRKAFFGGLSSPWFLHFDGQRPYWVRVTGTNLDAFEEIVKRWDSEETR
jgi:hypothetical protein